MNALKNAVLAFVAIASVNVMAQTDGPSAPLNFSTLTRAEVMADLHVWRQAGMDEFLYREASDPVSTRHDAALARYQALRNSAAYTQLVKTLRQQVRTNIAAR